jgi:hypothetical protein
LKKLEEIDLEIYNEDEYKSYVLEEQKNIRKMFGIPERALKKAFSLFREEDFITEYKFMYHNASLKELLDHKFLVAEDYFMSGRRSPTPMIKFEKDPFEMVRVVRNQIMEEKKKGEDLPIFIKLEHIKHFLKTGKIRIPNEVRRKKKISKKKAKLEDEKQETSLII